MFDVVNSEIIGARRGFEIRHAGRLRTGALTRLIDELLWELEELNLKDIRTVPSQLRLRVVEAVATVTGTPLERIPVRHKTVLALDLLYEAQDVVARLKQPHVEPDLGVGRGGG